MGAERNMVVGLASSCVQLAFGELVAAYVKGARSPITGTARSVIDFTPGPMTDIVVAVLQAKDKPVLIGSVVGGSVAVGAAAGHVSAKRPLAGGALMVGQGVIAGLAGARRPEEDRRRSVCAASAGAAGGLASLLLLRRRPGVKRLGATFMGAAGAALLARRRAGARQREELKAHERVVLPSPGSARPEIPAAATFDVPGMTPILTPVRDFYETDVTLPAPVVDPAGWRLRVHGSVAQAFELSLDELLGLDLVEHYATLECVHNPIGGDRIGTARWLGVPVRQLLDRAGVKPGADQVLARAVDGFTAGIPVGLAYEDRPALIVVGMNEAPLTVGHGFPARLLVPGLYGYDANTKWLSELQLTTFAAVADYWARRGWPRTPAAVRPSSRIDVPKDRARLTAGATLIAGVAWAPPTGVGGVEVSIDGGPWQQAEIAREVAPTVWRQWRCPASLEPGEHVLRVRTAGRAAQQPDVPAPPFPHGSGGYHTIRVSVASDGERLDDRGARRERRADLSARLALAKQGVDAWLRHGFPRKPEFNG